jgi:hypothetical protein
MNQSIQGKVGEETMDCVIPYERKIKCIEFKGETTKFVYEREMVSKKKIIQKTRTGVTTETTEEIKEDKTKKITMKTYGQTNEEDCEHFFESFEKLQRELHTEWEKSSANKVNDAQILFDAFDQMLTGTASSEWHDVLASNNKRDWEAFKCLVSQYITTKVLSEDAYTRQVTYMQERKKPFNMGVKEWWLRMQTMDRYLKYFFPNFSSLKRWFPSTDFNGWWNEGGLTEQEKKRIVVTKMAG